MNTHFFRCVLVALTLTVAASAFGAETASRPATAEKASNASLVEKRPDPSAQTTVSDRVESAGIVHPLMVAAGAALLGFLLTLFHLLRKLSTYWGLRILRNKWSIGFLLAGTGFSILSSPIVIKMLASYGGTWFASLESFTKIGTSVGASALGSTFVSGVQRVFGRSKSGRLDSEEGGKSQPKGFFFDRIIESVESQINDELYRLAKEFDWTAIAEIAGKVIFAAQRISETQRNKVLKQIEELQKPGKKKDNQDMKKYEALNLVLRCVSFGSLMRECEKERKKSDEKVD